MWISNMTFYFLFLCYNLGKYQGGKRFMEKEIKTCKIARILKIGSLVFLGVGIVGSLVMAEESQMVLKQTKSLWSYEEDEDEEDSFETVTKFNASTFLGSIMAVTAASGLAYGFGELIQLQYDNNELLKTVVSKKKDEEVEDEKAV